MAKKIIRSRSIALGVLLEKQALCGRKDVKKHSHSIAATSLLQRENLYCNQNKQNK
jgi:hypothetical protein